MVHSRTKLVSARLTAAEYAAVEQAAGGEPLSAWARAVLLRAATRPAANPVPATTPDSDQGRHSTPGLSSEHATSLHGRVVTPLPVQVVRHTAATPLELGRMIGTVVRSPAWLPSILVAACLSAGVIAAARYAHVWTPLQRQYFWSYVWSGLAVTERGSYRLLTGADRQWAAQYQPGDVVRYTRGSQTYGFAAGDYARVTRVNAEDNLLTVTRKYCVQVTYDPRRLQGVTVYREAERAFSVGDRVQFTAPDRQRQIANRELATIEHVTAGGRLRLHLDSGRTVAFTLRDCPHLDHGYAVTSYSSQGQTANRVLVHVDTGRAPEGLVNRRLAYVALSRGRFDAQIFTDDKSRLTEVLGRDVSRRAAIEPGHERKPVAEQIQPAPAVVRAFWIGL